MSEHQPSPGRRVLRAGAVDHAIDHAVRRMMQIDPSPALGPRVRSRIASSPIRRSLFSAPYLAAAGALAVLLLAVGLLRPGVGRDTASTTTAGNQAAPSAPRADGRVQAEEPKGSTESLRSDPATNSVHSSRAASQASNAVPAPPAAQERTEGVSPRAIVAAADAKGRAEAIPMPEIGNLFGAPGNAVAGANFAGVPEPTVVPPTGPTASPLEIVHLTLPPLTIEPLRIPPIPASGKER